MKADILAIEADTAGHFLLLERAASGWETAPELISWAKLPDGAFRRAGSPKLAIVAFGSQRPWLLPESVRPRLVVKIWRPEPNRFAFGRVNGATMKWFRQPPPPPGQPVRLDFRTAPKLPNTWKGFDTRRSVDVLDQVDAYRTVAQAMVDASPELTGKISAELYVRGRKVELMIEFRDGEAYLVGVTGNSVTVRPHARSDSMTLHAIPDEVPSLSSAGVPRIVGWVWGRLDCAGEAVSWHFATASELADHVGNQGGDP